MYIVYNTFVINFHTFSIYIRIRVIIYLNLLNEKSCKSNFTHYVNDNKNWNVLC